MKKEYIKETLESLKEAGISFATGVPDSWGRNILEALEDSPDFKFIQVSNEGVGYGLCAGAWFAGRRGCLVMENSGLRVAMEAIARLSIGAGIPVLLLMSYRGDIGETEHWAVNHGKTMEPLLNALRIPYTIIRKPEDLRKGIIRAARLAFISLYPTAVIIGGDLVW
ncbi:MAG: sulfopyruvate decarboxylase [Nitrososphaerota archaeon]|jgi:sulfopyruvate decarboxylase subunit alpha|nr:sulfopyruvate decarboxylase [Nitrososphaerota archaeon]MDG7045778.1 sulfopyruvate decarboxylase [Nitrososphaerota archaeon]